MEFSHAGFCRKRQACQGRLRGVAVGNYSVSGTSDQAQSEPAQRHASHPQGQCKEGRSPTEWDCLRFMGKKTKKTVEVQPIGKPRDWTGPRDPLRDPEGERGLSALA